MILEAGQHPAYEELSLSVAPSLPEGTFCPQVFFAHFTKLRESRKWSHCFSQGQKYTVLLPIKALNSWQQVGDKCRDLSLTSRSIICWSRRLMQIIDLRDTNKSQYFAITKSNNGFVNRAQSLFSYLNHSLKCSLKRFVMFHTDRGYNILHELNIICSETHQEQITYLKAAFCRSG